MTNGVGTLSRERREAQRAFCEEQYGALVRYCFRLCRDEQTARDVAQEAFVRLFGRWVDVREPRPYLYLVATNVLRRMARRRDWEAAAVALAHARPERVEAHDSGVRDAVDRLSRRRRDVILLYYYADLPVAAIARALRQPEGTVRRLLTEARADLARVLTEGP